MITPVTLANFQAMFPELANSVTQAYLDAWSPLVAIYISEGVFKKTVNGAVQDVSTYASALLIAHFLKLDELKGGGAVTMDKIGQLSTQQAALEGPSNLDITSYGKRFWQLTRIMVGVAGTWSNTNPIPVPPNSFPSPSWPSGL
jgi:hypothetical protein